MTGGDLKEKTEDVRKRLLRLACRFPSAHLGSCLSSLEIMTFLIFDTLRRDDILIVSKGHIGLLQFALLIEQGKINEDFKGIRSHPEKNEELGFLFTQGSLGHGFAFACGIALANRKKNVYCLLSDGECDEGSTWEIARIVTEQNLRNLKVILDCNGWSAYRKATAMNKLIKRWKAFGWEIRTLNQTESLNFKIRNEQPVAFFLKTIKGKGFLENKLESHYLKIHEKDIR